MFTRLVTTVTTELKKPKKKTFHKKSHRWRSCSGRAFLPARYSSGRARSRSCTASWGRARRPPASAPASSSRSRPSGTGTRSRRCRLKKTGSETGLRTCSQCWKMYSIAHNELQKPSDHVTRITINSIELLGYWPRMKLKSILSIWAI